MRDWRKEQEEKEDARRGKQYKKLVEKYEGLLKRHELANTLTQEMKIWLGQKQVEYIQRRKAIEMSLIQDCITYLESPPSPIVKNEIKIATV